ncbi:hypothetical protein [Psychromonas sp. MME2]
MKEHGSYKIELYEQVIIVRFISSWNRETSENMCKEFMQIASTITDNPWACLIDLTQWGLGGPEVWGPILDTNHWCAKNNQMHEAVVCSQVIQEHILRELQTALPTTKSGFFKTEADAEIWLNSKGYKILKEA